MADTAIDQPGQRPGKQQGEQRGQLAKLTQPPLSFYDMLSHVNHDLTIRAYRAGSLTVEVALVCKTCGRELRTAGNPIASHTLQIRAIALYIDEFGQNRGSPFIVNCQTWASRRTEIEAAVYSRISKDRVQSILVDDNTNPSLFEAFWHQLTPDAPGPISS